MYFLLVLYPFSCTPLVGKYCCSTSLSSLPFPNKKMSVIRVRKALSLFHRKNKLTTCIGKLNFKCQIRDSRYFLRGHMTNLNADMLKITLKINSFMSNKCIYLLVSHADITPEYIHA